MGFQYLWDGQENEGMFPKKNVWKGGKQTQSTSEQGEELKRQSYNPRE